MKHLVSMGIITAVCFAGELLHFLLPLPVPASVYGLVIMLILLMSGAVKVEKIEKTAGFFLTVMPIFFLEPAVKLMDSLPVLQGYLVQILCMCLLSTAAVIVVTGLTAQGMMRRQKHKQGNMKETLKKEKEEKKRSKK